MPPAPLKPIQRYIRYECPVLEQRLKRHALIIAIACLEFAIACFDWAQSQIERMPEYRIRLQLAVIRAKRFFVRLAIKLAMLDERYQVAATASNLWSRKSAIATKVFDKVFALN